MNHPHWVVLCVVTGVLAASACGDGDDSGDGHSTAGSSGHAGAGSGTEAGAGAGGSSGSNGAAGSSAGDEAGGSNTGGRGGDASGGEAQGGAGNGGAGAASTAGEAGSTAGGSGGSGECQAVEKEQSLAAGVHVTACSDITYATNPPSSGEHYPVWADYGVYDFALPRGYWVHNLEHGSVVVSYNCQNCAAEVDAAKAWLAALEPDAACASGPPRVLLLPDPALDVRWAASSWGFTLRADCFDSEAFSDFYVKHAGKAPAPEAAICATGTDFRASGACGI